MEFCSFPLVVYSELQPIFEAAFGIVFSLCRNSSGSLPAFGGLLTACSVILLTDDIDVATLSSEQTP